MKPSSFICGAKTILLRLLLCDSGNIPSPCSLFIFTFVCVACLGTRRKLGMKIEFIQCAPITSAEFSSMQIKLALIKGPRVFEIINFLLCEKLDVVFWWFFFLLPSPSFHPAPIHIKHSLAVI